MEEDACRAISENTGLPIEEVKRYICNGRGNDLFLLMADAEDRPHPEYIVNLLNKCHPITRKNCPQPMDAAGGGKSKVHNLSKKRKKNTMKHKRKSYKKHIRKRKTYKKKRSKRKNTKRRNNYLKVS